MYTNYSREYNAYLVFLKLYLNHNNNIIIISAQSRLNREYRWFVCVLVRWNKIVIRYNYILA